MQTFVIAFLFNAVIDFSFVAPSVASFGHRSRSNEDHSETEQRLIRHILYQYDTDARGVININSTIMVQIELLLLRIQELDERSQVLTTTGHIICDWQDDRLQWRKEDFDDIHDVVLAPGRIWLPELALMNGAEVLTPDFSKVRVLVSHNGRVHWEPGGIFTTSCDINIRYFPFDNQTCTIQFGAWAYYSARMNITSASQRIQTRNYRLNGEWDMYGTRAEWRENTLPCCPKTRYPYVEFTLFLRRRQAFYVMNIILPCTMLSVLVMVTFCLPPDAGEKISLGISVLLAFAVFLLMVAENVPRTSLHIPIMVIYLTCTMALGTASVCFTVLVLNLHHRDHECPVPDWARFLILNHLSRVLRVGARKPQTKANNDLLESAEQTDGVRDQLKRTVAADAAILTPVILGSEVKNPEVFYCSGVDDLNGGGLKCDHRQDWKELAHVLDRLYFWVIFVAMTSSAMIILLVPYYSQKMST